MMRSGATAMTEKPLLDRPRHWSAGWRMAIFFLSASSIWCLLAEFYGLCSMRTFTLWILIPATVVLMAMALIDRARGGRPLLRACVMGAVGGMLGAIAYGLFRLPFVVASV